MNCTANQQCATSKANKKNCRKNYSLVHKKSAVCILALRKEVEKGSIKTNQQNPNNKTTTLLFHSWKTNLGKYQISSMPNARYNSSVLSSGSQILNEIYEQFIY